MRLMDSILRGYVTFLNKNVTIKLRTRFNGTGRDNKDFYIRTLTSGDPANNGLYMQKYSNDNFVSSLMKVDWDTGNAWYYAPLNLPVLQLGSSSAPTPLKGGLFFNTTNNTWYKCNDGVTWVTANI